MRIAILVVSIFLTIIVGLQSCTVMVGAGLAKNQALSGGGSAGVFMAFLFVLGAAFAMGLPRFSMIAFGIAAATGFLAGSTTRFHDLSIWAGVSLLLAIMSYFGVRELKRKKVGE